jgi:hypothetical protein
MLGRGRKLISDTMKPYIDKITYCHTDGFLSTEELPLKTGTNLGDLKFDGYCEECEVIGCNKKIIGFE